MHKIKIMKTNTETILTVLKVLAWIVFIGLCINCGSQIVAFIIGFIKPEWTQNMYNVDTNWFKLREEGEWIYVCAMSLIIAISAFKAYIWYILIELLSKLNLQSPFTMEVAKKLESIAYQLLVVWIASSVGNGFFEGLEKRGIASIGRLEDASEFIFIAGIVYIISQIFKRGIEIQQENELTV